MRAILAALTRRRAGRAVALGLFAAVAAGFAAAPVEAGSSSHGKTTPGDKQAAQEADQEADQEAKPAEAPAAESAPADTSPDPASKTAKAEGAAETTAATPSGPAAETSASPLGGGWETETDTLVRPETADEQITDEEALEIIDKVNAYFNGLDKFKTEFVQTDVNNEQKTGEFYFQRPGKVRFDYNRPSRLKIISDGEYLAVENHDLKTSDRYPLESTPFKLLLSEEVNLLRDARILSIDRGENILILTLADKTGESPGRIRLFFHTDPELKLASWIITDPQGLDTRVDLIAIERDVELSASLFEFSDIALPNFNR